MPGGEASRAKHAPQTNMLVHAGSGASPRKSLFKRSTFIADAESWAKPDAADWKLDSAVF